MTLQIVALLPMKANSERVVGKNFKNFCGKPLFRWVLDTLLSVPEISCVVINTDARDILEDHGLSEGERVKIRDRPQEICGDLVSMNSVIADDVSNLDADFFVMTHTTNPLLSKRTVQEAIHGFQAALEFNECDTLFTVNMVQERFYTSEGKAINHDPENLIRTQDLPPWYRENSNLYLFTKNSFNATGARIGKRPKMLTTPAFESIDIDTRDDWDFAEAVVNFYVGKGII